MPRNTSTRLAFLDNLKVFLTLLVIFHHAGQPYGPGGWWYTESTAKTLWLGPFFWFNASFFMGLFFLLSAYFMPGSIDRKGAGAFARDRLLRLGVPLVVFVLGIIPLLMYGYFINFRGGHAGYGEYFIKYFLGIGAARPVGWTGPSWPDMQFAHLWFIEHLLVYGLVYALWRFVFRRDASADRRPLPGDGAILLYLVGLTLVSLIVRIWWPMNRWAGILGFFQSEPAHLPQYLSLFVVGIMAFRGDWIVRFPVARAYRWLGVGVAAAAGGVGLILLNRLGPSRLDSAWFEPVLAVLECTLAVGLSVGLPVLFRERFAGQGRLMRALAADAFAVYLFHLPIVVVLHYALRPLALGAGLSFFLAGTAGVVITFAFCHLLRQIPFVRRIL